MTWETGTQLTKGERDSSFLGPGRNASVLALVIILVLVVGARLVVIHEAGFKAEVLHVFLILVRVRIVTQEAEAKVWQISRRPACPRYRGGTGAHYN